LAASEQSECVRPRLAHDAKRVYDCDLQTLELDFDRASGYCPEIGVCPRVTDYQPKVEP